MNCLYVKIPEEFAGFILQGRCWVVHIPFVRRVKYEFHYSQWITLPTQSCLVLYSFCDNLLHLLIMWLIVSSLTPHNLLLLFCCVLSILAFIWFVLMVLFCYHYYYHFFFFCLLSFLFKILIPTIYYFFVSNCRDFFFSYFFLSIFFWTNTNHIILWIIHEQGSLKDSQVYIGVQIMYLHKIGLRLTVSKTLIIL